MKITTSAPGKVVILGEYAVLEGAPALVMAVDRRVRVTLTTHGKPYCSVAAPGWTEETARFHFEAAGQVRFEGDSRDFSLVEHVIGEFSRWSGVEPVASFDLVLDSGSLMESAAGGPVKLGLGSSAALTVALCSALSYYVAAHHQRTRAPDLGTLIGIHSALQERRGSGLDVAASLHGGLIEYRRLPAPRARTAELPAGVATCFVWTGRQAATGAFLAGVDRWRQEGERPYRRAMEALTELARAGTQAVLANESEEFLRMTDSYAEALEDLGKASGTDIVSRPHRRLREIARDHGVVYKSCGAGGGDVGVGLSCDAAALAGFQAAVAADSFKCLSLNIDRQGVETRSES
ncbi:MAG: hypothetical protein WB783_06515 [Arenicellales bacterium]